nr:hypothetical protein [Corynebacterium lactis]
MDVTPIVEVLQAIPNPSAPTININIDPTFEGDINLLHFGDINMPFGRDFSKFGNLNAPFGQDFLDTTQVNDDSTNVAVGGTNDKSIVTGDQTNVKADSILPGSPSLPKLV